jgi:hypothetical protein
LLALRGLNGMNFFSGVIVKNQKIKELEEDFKVKLQVRSQNP